MSEIVGRCAYGRDETRKHHKGGGGALRALAAGLAALVIAQIAMSQGAGAAGSAREIVEESQKRTDSRSERYEGLLQSFDAQGKTTEKRWTYERLGAHGQSKSVIRFMAPPEVKGVALLVINHADRASDQWMWTPALERDRRIATQDRGTRFFGTDFSFEDLEERDVDQYEYTLEGESTLDGAACWIVASVPKQSKSSQYTKMLMWIRHDNYTVVRIDSYVKDQVLRRLTYSDLSNIQGIWTARETIMADLRRGTRTRLALDKIEYNLPLKDEIFTVQALRLQ
jgi:hypothetical protein